MTTCQVAGAFPKAYYDMSGLYKLGDSGGKAEPYT